MPRKHVLGETDDDRIFIGEDLTIRCQQVVQNQVTKVDAVEGDVSGNEYAFEIKLSPGDTAAIIDLATGGDGITFDAGDTGLGELAGANTVVVIAVSDTETEKITAPGLYHWDLWRTDSGSEGVVAYGRIRFSDSVTM